MSGWDRRSFLKAGAFGSAGLALENKRSHLTGVAKPWNARVERALRRFKNPAPTVCRMCPAHCGIRAFRDGDRVVQLQGAPGAPNNQGGVCSRAYAGLERLYDAERQLTPLKRTGPRGGGQWAPVSWTEVIAEISGRLSGSSVLHLGQEELLVQELRDILPWGHLVVDRTFPGRAGNGEQWYGTPVIAADLSRARTVFLLGARVLDGRFSVPLAKDLVKGRQEGAAIHLFDPYAGATGSFADWHPVVPGSEAAVAWGVARLIFQWGAEDQDALAAGVSDSVEDLKVALEPFTPEAVQEATGVPASRLVSLARRFAQARPAVAVAPVDSPAAPAAALLNHLAGALNVRGGLTTARGPFFLRALEPTGTPEALLADLVAGRARTDLYWAVDANPAYDAPEGGRVAAALADPERVGLLVAMDTHLTETALLADYFLPLATHFESWGLVEGCVPDGRSYLFLQQPVTRPASEPDKLKAAQAEHLSLFEPWPRALGEARSISDVLVEVASAREANPFPNTREFLGELLRKSWGPGSFEALRARGIWVAEEAKAANPAEPVSLLAEVPAEPPPKGEGLFLVGYAPTNLPQSYGNTRWGRELSHRCEALLHPTTAAALGLRPGDRVVLKTESGQARVRVRTLQGVHPQAVVLPDGFGREAGGHVARGEPTPPAPAPRPFLVSRKDFLANPLGLAPQEVEAGEPIWWHEAGAGASWRALVPFRITPAGTQDWGAVRVEVVRG